MEAPTLIVWFLIFLIFFTFRSQLYGVDHPYLSPPLGSLCFTYDFPRISYFCITLYFIYPSDRLLFSFPFSLSFYILYIHIIVILTTPGSPLLLICLKVWDNLFSLI